MDEDGEELLLFAISNSNEVFLKHAFRNVILDSTFLDPGGEIGKRVVAAVINILNQSTKTELILNILIFADFTRWGSEELK